jgi:chemotaxis protein MotB
MRTIALTFLLTACVAKKDHLALQSQFDAARADAAAALQERDGKVQSLEAALAAEQARAAELETARAALESALAAKTAEADALNAEKAALVKDRTRLKASIQETETALRELSARKAQAEQRIQQYKELLSRFQALIDAGRLKVKIVDGRMVVELATDVLFASGKADLSDAGKAAVAEVGAVLAQMPDRKFQVEGHTDNVPIKTPQFPSNWELASARAITVVRALVDAGLRPSHVSAAAYGEFRPVAPNDSAEGKAANRRIEITVVADLSQLPGFEELQEMSGG